MGDLSLDAYPDQEPTREVNTPLSLEACRVEGILPSELLYRPLNSFAKPGLPQEIQKLHFDFYETKRVESLQNVRNIKQKLKRQRALSDSKSISFILSKSEQFEQSLQASKAKQIALISKAAVHEAIHAKKLSKLKSDEEAKAELEREKRRVETLRIRREAEEKRRIEMEKLKKEKEDEERRDKIRNMQMERDNDVMKRIQEREDKLQHERLAQRSHNDRVREEIYARLSERQLEQESWKTARELKNSKREAEREQKLEQQKKEFREKLKEKAKMRAMNRAQARQQADSFQKKRTMEFLLNEERTEERTEVFQRKMQEKIQLLRKISSEKGLRIRQVQESAIANSMTTRMKIMDAMTKSQRRAETQRKKLNEQFVMRKHLTDLKRLKKDYYIERQRRRDEYKKEQSSRKLLEIQSRLEAFEAVKDKMMQDRLHLSLESEQLKLSIKGAMQRMLVTKKWDEEEIMRLVAKGKDEETGMDGNGGYNE